MTAIGEKFRIRSLEKVLKFLRFRRMEDADTFTHQIWVMRILEYDYFFFFFLSRVILSIFLFALKALDLFLVESSFLPPSLSLFILYVLALSQLLLVSVHVFPMFKSKSSYLFLPFFIFISLSSLLWGFSPSLLWFSLFFLSSFLAWDLPALLILLTPHIISSGANVPLLFNLSGTLLHKKRSDVMHQKHFLDI